MSIWSARVKLTTWEKILLWLAFTIIFSILISFGINKVKNKLEESTVDANNATSVNDIFQNYAQNTTNSIEGE